MKKRLEEAGARVIMTREDDSYLGLYERAAVVNRFDGVLAISLHVNSHNNSKLHGVRFITTRTGPAAGDWRRRSTPAYQRAQDLRPVPSKPARKWSSPGRPRCRRSWWRWGFSPIVRKKISSGRVSSGRNWPPAFSKGSFIIWAGNSMLSRAICRTYGGRIDGE